MMTSTAPMALRTLSFVKADEPTEEQLVRRTQAGDTQAFGALVERYMRRAYRVALGLVGSHEDALDLSQEAFVRAFRARHSLDPQRPIYPWLHRIVQRLCYNFLRDRSRRRRRLDDATPWLVEETSVRETRGSPSRQAEASDLRDRMMAALKSLPEKEREILVLREFEELKYKEIAEVLEIPIGTVMSRLYTARRRLAAALEGKL